MTQYSNDFEDQGYFTGRKVGKHRVAMTSISHFIAVVEEATYGNGGACTLAHAQVVFGRDRAYMF